MTQVDAMKYVITILRNTEELRGRYGTIGDTIRNDLIETFSHMIEVRTKPLTHEQRARKNECERARRARKREERDAAILEAIKPFLNEEEQTATEIAELINKGKPWKERISADELRSFFHRHKELNIECLPPRSAYTFRVRV